MRRGLYWGVGHGVALLALCAVPLSTGQTLSDQNQALLELGASLLILYLGAQLIWPMYRRRIHIHIHEHEHGYGYGYEYEYEYEYKSCEYEYEYESESEYE